MSRYRVGLVGLTGIAIAPSAAEPVVLGGEQPRAHAACYAVLPTTEVVAGRDLVPALFERFQTQWGHRWPTVATYRDDRQMLEGDQRAWVLARAGVPAIGGLAVHQVSTPRYQRVDGAAAIAELIDLVERPGEGRQGRARRARRAMSWRCSSRRREVTGRSSPPSPTPMYSVTAAALAASVVLR